MNYDYLLVIKYTNLSWLCGHLQIRNTILHTFDAFVDGVHQVQHLTACANRWTLALLRLRCRRVHHLHLFVLFLLNCHLQTKARLLLDRGGHRSTQWRAQGHCVLVRSSDTVPMNGSMTLLLFVSGHNLCPQGKTGQWQSDGTSSNTILFNVTWIKSRRRSRFQRNFDGSAQKWSGAGGEKPRLMRLDRL